MTYTVEVPFRLEVRPKDPDGLARAQEVFLEEMREAVSDCVLHVQERVKRIIEDDDIVNEGHLVNSIALAMGIEGRRDRGPGGHEPHLREVPGVRHRTALRALPPGQEPLQPGRRGLGLDPRRQEREPEPERRRGPEVRTTRTAAASSRAAIRPTSTPGTSCGPSPTRTPSRCGASSSRGRKQPFMYPGWIESLDFITRRLAQGGQRAAERLNTSGRSDVPLFGWPHAFLPHTLCDFLATPPWPEARVTTAVPRQRVYPLLVVQHAGLGRLGPTPRSKPMSPACRSTPGRSAGTRRRHSRRRCSDSWTPASTGPSRTPRSPWRTKPTPATTTRPTSSASPARAGRPLLRRVRQGLPRDRLLQSRSTCRREPPPIPLIPFFQHNSLFIF